MRIPLLALFLLLSCFAAIPAVAGLLFPPENVGSCGPGTLLYWTGSSVQCVPALSNINVACPAGQVLVGFTGDVASPSSNHERCYALPTCSSNQSLTFNGSAFSCNAAPPACGPSQVLTFDGSSYSCVTTSSPTCGADQVLTYMGGGFQCVSVNEAVPTCSGNQFLTYNGKTYQCATAPQIEWPTCAADQVLSSTAGGPVCVNQTGGVKTLTCMTTYAGGQYAFCPGGYVVTGCSAGMNHGSYTIADSYCYAQDMSTDWTGARCCMVQ